MLLGMRIKALREERNLTQEELAKMINVTKSAISYYENNKRIPTVTNLHDLAQAFNVSSDYLMGNDSFEIAENSDAKEYGMYMSNEEMEFIKEVRAHSKFHDSLISDPKRCVERIVKKLF